MNKKRTLFKTIMIFIVLFIFTTGYIIGYFYLTKIKHSKEAKEIEESFIGTYTNKENYFYNKELNLFILKPDIKVTSARKINGKIVYDVIYTTDKNSFRYTQGNSSGDTYIFTGCSYMFGEGINDDETLPYYFSKLLQFKANVLNIGLPGTSTNVSYIILKNSKLTDITDTKVKYIIYGFFCDHIFRNIAGAHQSGVFKIKGKELIEAKESVVSSEIYANSILRKIYEKDAINLTIKLIEEMNKLAKNKYNAKFLVFLYDKDKITYKVQDKLNELNIPNIMSKIEYSERPEGYYMIKNECHPTGNANEENATLIYDYIM